MLAFCQPPAIVRRALLGLCRLLRRMRARLRESGGDDNHAEVRGFLPRVVELGREVKVVAELMGLAVGEEEEGALLVELEERKED